MEPYIIPKMDTTMKINISKFVLILSVLANANLSAVSMVYNYRIAEITRQPFGQEEEKEKRHTTLLLIFDQYRKKYSGIKQNFAGGLGSFIYNFESSYCRVDGAFSHIREWENHATSFSGTETDDILFSFGSNLTRRNHSSATLSGLFGVPTHKILRLKHVDFGYNQVGTGIQLDGSYALSEQNILVGGARYVYFVPRNAQDCNCCNHRFTIGNVADLLTAYKHHWHNQGVELGYTARARFGARCCPNFDCAIQKSNYVRSNFYFIYKCKFLTDDIEHRLLFNVSYGFDHKPKIFGNKNIITLWAAWEVNF